jgi:hypothetical protein
MTDIAAAAIDSSDPEVVEWATAFFESWHVRGRSPSHVSSEKNSTAKTKTVV